MSKLIVASADTYVVSLPLRRPHSWAGLTTAGNREYVVLRLRLSDGTTGWGEAQTIPTWGGDDASRYGETPRGAIGLIRELLLPAIAEVDLSRIELVHAAMDRALRGHPYAKAAVEVAILDALARGLGVPVYRLLGGLYRERIELAHSIGLMDIRDAATEAAATVEGGIKTLKIKIGIDVERDVKTVAEIRNAVGPGVKIRVDGNQGYRTWREAVTAINRMSQFDIVYAEQPVDGLDQMAEVSARCDVPLMADESAWTDRDVVRIAQAQAAQYLSVYYTKPGGLWKARKLLAVAGAHRMISDINGSGEMGIGNAANLHLAAAAPEVALPGTIPVTSTAEVEQTKVAGRRYLDDIVVKPPVYADGFLHVPAGPGLGIEVDEKKIAKYQVR
ncbi:MAG: mandelate racemase [Xanthobacteraceae bacterium]|nr:mandelate racemase [Xanthobacteraceae bacterium]MBX3549015.1 mandelate racemase [Xanthobacteraceae bacterium]MCW5676556.1 mandelate racemase [Xanthobacteraceae bacterium]